MPLPSLLASGMAINLCLWGTDEIEGYNIIGDHDSTVFTFSRTDGHKYTDHSVLPIQTWSSRQTLNPRSLDSSERSDQSLPIWLSTSLNWHGICLLLTELLVPRSVLVSFFMPCLSNTALSPTEYWSKSLGFYAGALSYLALPALGYNFDTATIVASVAALPVVAKVGIKTTIAFPFVFHCLNGVRHLVSIQSRILSF
jgi:hypothetical protein